MKLASHLARFIFFISFIFSTSSQAHDGKKAGFAELFAGSRAKEYCSCIFEVGQTAAYCAELVYDSDHIPVDSLPVLSVSVDSEKKVVTVLNHHARWVSEMRGCVLDD